MDEQSGVLLEVVHRPNLNCLNQVQAHICILSMTLFLLVIRLLMKDDPELVTAVAGSLSPPDPTVPYNLTAPVEQLLRDKLHDPHDLSIEVEQLVFKHLNIEQGFFVEAGAGEGRECNILY